MLDYFSPVALLVLPEHEILFAPNSNYAQSGRKHAVLTSQKLSISALCSKRYSELQGTQKLVAASCQTR